MRQTSWPEKNFSNGQLSNNGGKLAFASFSCSKQNKQGHKFGPKRDSSTLFVFVSKMAFALKVFEGSKFSNIWRFSQYSKSFAACAHHVGGLELLHIMRKSRYRKISIKWNQFLEIARSVNVNLMLKNKIK